MNAFHAQPRRRSCLAVPAGSPRKLEKAAGIAADEVVIDLEDAVVVGAKEEARAAAIAALARPEWSARTVAVRINAPRSPWCHRDLAALAESPHRSLTIVLPKVESAADLEFAERLLDGAETGGRERPLGLQALIETPAGLLRAGEIAAASGRLQALILGYADLAAGLGRSRTAAGDPAAWGFAQDSALVAARTNGLQAIDGPHLGIEPDERFLAAARRARDLGFDGKWAIHPSQVEAINELFTPAPEEVAHARAVVEALERADREDRAGAVALDGEMLDEAQRVSALGILTRAGAEVGS